MEVVTISPRDLAVKRQTGEQVEVIDVRTPVVYREVHCSFARNVPLSDLDPKAVMNARNGTSDDPLYVMCRSGSRGKQACEKFLAAGYTNVVNVEDGTSAWADCGLPYHIGEVIPERDKLLVTTPERLRERFRLDVRTRSEVEAIDRPKKTVRIRDLETGRVYEESYDKLILAPGAAPIRPPIPGADLPNVFTLRNLADTDRIKNVVDAGVTRAVIVGAGFIGLELAENFVHRGIVTTILDRNQQVLAPFDAELTTPLRAALVEKGVEVLLGHPVHHAGYYPGAEGMTLKVIFDPQTGKLLGAQGVGGAGVDKRIDVLAVAIQAGMTVFDLEEMELCYAPQFGSAKDPVNMAGFVAGGLMRGDHPQTDWEAVSVGVDKPFLLDVRTPLEYASGHIPDAGNIPVDELRSRLAEVPVGRHVVAYCQVGQRGYCEPPHVWWTRS